MATEFSDFVGGQTPLDLGMSIARLAMRFGEVMRATAHPDGRPESDTTHTVMLCLLVAELAQLEGLDVGLCVQLALVHDLPETYAGDVSTARELSPEERAEKDRREAAAVERIESELGAESWTATMLRRYEAQDEPEARMVRFADKILPKLTHALNGGIRIQAISMSPDEAAERHKRQGAKFEALNHGLVATPAMFYAAHEAAVAAYRERLAEGPHDGGFQSHGFTVARGNVYFTGETEDGELLNCMAKMDDGVFGLWVSDDLFDDDPAAYIVGVYVDLDAFRRGERREFAEVVKAAEVEAAKPAVPCRRCSECRGQSHHWMEEFDDGDDETGAGDMWWGCKHCDVMMPMEDCDEDPEAMFIERMRWRQ